MKKRLKLEKFSDLGYITLEDPFNNEYRRGAIAGKIACVT